MIQDCATVFSQIFGDTPDVCAFAPGRVNLIGEHTDYNGGYVFPCALDLGIYGAAKKRKDNRLRFYSANFRSEGIISFSLDACANNDWTAYPMAVIRTFAVMGYPVNAGVDFVFTGDLPDGAGLSSSAAMEVLTGLLLRELFDFPITNQELAVFGQFAENRFIGVNCGIMDQFASAMGKRGCAILLNSNTLAHSYVPINSDDVSLVLINSGVKHALASSAYNERRRGCETALSRMNEAKRIPSICSLKPQEFEQLKQYIGDPICLKRARHAVYENHRTKIAADALSRGELGEFGRLMCESHRSLQQDYEVSCPELDFLAETAWKIDGVIGARMTGGGFGGCTVNLVQNESVDSFINIIQCAYQQRFHRQAAAYAVKIGDGAHLLAKR